jgi:hypothetical protein
MTSHRVRFSIDDEQGGPVPPPPTRNPDIHFQRINGGRSRPQPPIQSPVPRALPTQYSPLTPDSSDSPSPSYLPGYYGYPAPGYVMQNAPWVNPVPYPAHTDPESTARPWTQHLATKIGSYDRTTLSGLTLRGRAVRGSTSTCSDSCPTANVIDGAFRPEKR